MSSEELFVQRVPGHDRRIPEREANAPGFTVLKNLVPLQLTPQLLVQLVLISIKEERVHRQL